MAENLRKRIAGYDFHDFYVIIIADCGVLSNI
jgi:hypothetical protein